MLEGPGHEHSCVLHAKGRAIDSSEFLRAWGAHNRTFVFKLKIKYALKFEYLSIGWEVGGGGGGGGGGKVCRWLDVTEKGSPCTLPT
jgi:hypothetical protein